MHVGFFLFSDAFSFSYSILLDIPAALVTDKDSTVQRHRENMVLITYAGGSRKIQSERAVQGRHDNLQC